MTLSTFALVTLLFTLPSTGKHSWTDPSQGPDSVMVECSGGQAIHQLATVRVYFNPNTGGGWRRVAEMGVAGMEGRPDSITVDSGPGGHYYVTTTNPAGESCASPVIYVPGSVVTGIEPEVAARPATVRIFDVQGRLVHSVTRSGVYWERTRYHDGSETVRRVVLVK